MKEWKGIIVHCSDSEWGDNLTIDKWHRERGWQGCGYHFVITNHNPRHKQPWFFTDGQIQLGRNINTAGAHAHGYNNDYIGICLIGKKEFTIAQMVALEALINELKRKYKIVNENIIGHRDCENNGGKLCPNWDVKKWVEETF